MRPFRFFFGVSLAVILFFWFARFVVFALIAAAIMSIVFHIGRKTKNFFRNLRWEDEGYYRDEYIAPYSMSRKFARRSEDMFYDFPQRRAEHLTDFRRIEIK